MEIDKVELKFTAVPADKGRVIAFLSDHKMQQRKVYFYDTKPVTLAKRHLVLRGRVTEGAGDTTVKLRPVEEDVAAAARQKNKKVRVENDEVAGKQTLSAKLDQDDVDAAAVKKGDWDALFSGKQRDLAGDVDFATLEVLGPITARVWEIEDLPGFPYKLGGEEWAVGDLHFVELSIKVDPDEADEARVAFNAFLAGLVKDLNGDQSRKTERVLEVLGG